MRTLRDYQGEAIEAVRARLDKDASTLLVLPTGTGKTVVMAKLASEWGRGNVLLLAHRVELLDQAADKIAPELGYRPVVEQGERGMDVDLLWQGGSVLVGSVQTMRGDKRLAKFARHPFDLILVDEAHHATAASYRKVVDYFTAINPACKVLGVTATPNRADNAALGVVFDTVAYSLGIAEAIDRGWLVPIEQEFVSVDQVDFSGVSTATNEVGESDLKAAELEQVLVEEEALHAMAVPIMDRAAGRQALVFCAGVAHSHMLASVLNRYRDGCAAAVDGKTHPPGCAERKQIVADFHAGKLQYLVNFGVFTEGFDCPAAAVVAMARPTKSVGLYTQMLGRGTRPLDGVVDAHPTAEARRAAIASSGKPHMLSLDFVGNSRHKLVSSVDILGGNYDVEVRDLASRRLAEKGGGVKEELEKARVEIALLREEKRRKAVKASVPYSTEKVDPFGHGPEVAAGSDGVVRGGASDAQVGFLVNLGVQYDTAARYTRRQASAVIEKLKAERCTKKQRAVLAKYGEDVEVNFEEASRIIDAISKNGWRPRERQTA